MATSPGMDYPTFLWIDVVGLGNADFESPGIYKSSKGNHRLFVRIRSPIWTVATGPLIAISLKKEDERMSTFCTNCGRELPDHAVFCPSCGTKMEVPCCPACGKEIELDSMFCIHCGQKLVNDQTEEALETAAHSEEPSSPQNMPALKPEDVIGRWKLVTIQNAENPEWKTHDIPLEEMLYLRFSSKTYSALNAAGVVVGSGQWELSGEKVVTDNGIALLLKDGILAMENPEDGCIYRFCPLEDDIPAPDSSRKLAEEQTFSWKYKKAGRGILKIINAVTVSLSENMLTVYERWHSTLSERDAAQHTRELPRGEICRAEVRKRRLSPLYLLLLLACAAAVFFIAGEVGANGPISAAAALAFAAVMALFYRFDLCHPELQLHLTSGKKVRLPAETVNDLAPVHAEIVKWARLKSGGDASREKPKSRKKRVLIAVGIVAGAAAVLLGVITCFEQVYLLRKLPETVLASEAAVDLVREQMKTDFNFDGLDADVHIEGGRLADTPSFPQKEGKLYTFFFVDFIYDVVVTNATGENASGTITADMSFSAEPFSQEPTGILINQLEYSDDLKGFLELKVQEEPDMGVSDVSGNGTEAELPVQSEMEVSSLLEGKWYATNLDGSLPFVSGAYIDPMSSNSDAIYGLELDVQEINGAYFAYLYSNLHPFDYGFDYQTLDGDPFLPITQINASTWEIRFDEIDPSSEYHEIMNTAVVTLSTNPLGEMFIEISNISTPVSRTRLYPSTEWLSGSLQYYDEDNSFSEYGEGDASPISALDCAKFLQDNLYGTWYCDTGVYADNLYLSADSIRIHTMQGSFYRDYAYYLDFSFVYDPTSTHTLQIPASPDGYYTELYLDGNHYYR